MKTFTYNISQCENNTNTIMNTFIIVALVPLMGNLQNFVG